MNYNNQTNLCSNLCRISVVQHNITGIEKLCCRRAFVFFEPFPLSAPSNSSSSFFGSSHARLTHVTACSNCERENRIKYMRRTTSRSHNKETRCHLVCAEIALSRSFKLTHSSTNPGLAGTPISVFQFTFFFFC